MPNDIRIEITGVQATIESLAKYEGLAYAGILARALDKAGEVIQKEVDRLTPMRLLTDAIGGLVAPEKLRDSLRRDVKIYNNKRGGYAEIYHRGYGFLVNWLEYGHIMRGHKPDKKILKGPRTPEGFVYPGGIARSYPFMRKAADQSAEAALDAFEKALDEGIAAAERGVSSGSGSYSKAKEAA